jgi:sortase A
MKRSSTLLGLLVFVLSGVLLGIGIFQPIPSLVKQSQISIQSPDIDRSLSPHPTESSIRIENPITLKVPTIKVNASIESVGLDVQGRMDVPKNANNVAWYNLGVKPGEIGNAVMAGHLDKANGTPAVFWNLNALQIGDVIQVVDQSGKSITFKVTDKKTFDNDTFPIKEVFGEFSKARLNLITCQGVWNKDTRNYSQRTVVFSEIVQ